MSEQPDLHQCVGDAVNEISAASAALSGFMENMQKRVADLVECQEHKQSVALALCAEDVAKTAFQIRELAEAVHRGLAKRLNLEKRL